MGIRRRSGRSRRQSHRRNTSPASTTDLDFEAECKALVVATRRLFDVTPEPLTTVMIEPLADPVPANLHSRSADHLAEVTGLRERQEQLEAQLEFMRRDVTAASAQNAELTRQLADSETRAQHSLEEIRRVEGEHESRRLGDADALGEFSRREASYRREIDLLQQAYADLVALNAEQEAESAGFTNSLSQTSAELDTLRQEVTARDNDLERLRRTMAMREVQAAEHAEELRLALLESESQRAAEAEEFVILLGERSGQDQTRT